MVFDPITALPGIGAAVMSLYNWFQANRGGVLEPDRIISFGVWNVSRTDGNRKFLYFPITVHNIGIKPGILNDVSITFDGRPVEIGRRVKLNPQSTGGAHNLSQQDFIEEIPPFPLFVPPKQGEILLLECYDSPENEAIIPDKNLNCIISINYGKGNQKEIKFPFQLSSEDFKSARTIVWKKVSSEK